ncbi:hypothetical protein F751_5010 [Auxenochlorella protothecoides]|uniref:Uncharacterized protein n=2 Tax=Auxenochlorella protothecoides TaxID=3075 RepID=A0A087SEL4_AUXPR|nr:hypothetical protein F751_5010 [Auxenochlorella protothecoides]KFM24168.1 hypothetical protein F751_5010 [Auxenochlorella protothecoides]
MVVSGNLVAGVGVLKIGFKDSAYSMPNSEEVAPGGPITSYTRTHFFHLGGITDAWVWYTDSTGHQFPGISGSLTTETETVESAPHHVRPRYIGKDGVVQFLPGLDLIYTNAPPPPPLA